MARPCPACGRPNGDRAPTCLYCSAPLPEVKQEDARAAAQEASASRRHLIILAPVEGVLDGKVESLARAAALSLYEAKLLLAARRFRLLKKVDGGADAEALSRQLTDAGVPHSTVPEADLEAVPLRTIHGASFDPRGLTFRLAKGESVSVPYDDFLILVKGEITHERFEEKRLATNRRASQRLTPTYRLHIYCCTSGAFDLDPEAFDWTVLGEDQSRSLFLNLEKLMTEIVKRNASVEIDDRFGSETVVLTRKEAGNDPAVLLSGNAKDQRAVLYDNEPQFRYFSRWRFLVAQTYSSNSYTTR